MTDQTTGASMSSENPRAVGSQVERGVRPLVEPVGFRTRYRSEVGMIGHYPWTYADHGRRRTDRPECEYEDLFTAEQVRTLLAAEREQWKQDQQAWEDTRTQRDELLAHIAGKAPLPQWAADWLKA